MKKILIKFLLGLNLFLSCNAFSFDFIPLDTQIQTVQEEADSSILGFKVVGHFFQEYSMGMRFNEKRKLAFISFVATRPQESGIRIINLVNPKKPTQTSFYPTKNSLPRDVVISASGNRMIVATNRSLEIVDIEHPEYPKLLDNYSINPDDCNIAWVSEGGDRLYLVEDGKFEILNIRNPSAPNLLSSKKIGRIDAIYVSSDGLFAYFTDKQGLHLLDIKHPKNPQLIASTPIVSIGQYPRFGPIAATEDGKLIVFGDFDVYRERSSVRLARLDSKGHLAIIDGSNLSINSDHAFGIQIRSAGSRLYLLTGEDGIIEINITDQSKLNLIGNLRIPLSNHMINFGHGDFYITQDEKYLLVPITARKDENTNDVGGLTIYSRDKIIK